MKKDRLVNACDALVGLACKKCCQGDEQGTGTCLSNCEEVSEAIEAVKEAKNE